MSHPIRFKGQTYNSVEDMTPEDRTAYEAGRAQIQAGMAQFEAGEAQIRAGEAKYQAGMAEYEAAERGSRGVAHAWDTGSNGINVPAGYESVTQLGPAEQVFLINRELAAGIVGIVFGLMGLIPGGLFFVMLIASIVQGHFEPFYLILTPLFLGLGGFIFAAGWRTLWSQWRGIRSLVIYKDGFACHQSETVQVWPWQEITTIYSDESFHTMKRGFYTTLIYTLSKQNGETITLSDSQFLEIRKLISTIKQRVVPLLSPPLKKAYDEGQSVTFGPVTVSKQGIQAHGKEFAWGDVLNVEVKKGNLTINLKEAKLVGGHPGVRGRTIPNIESLCQLIGLDPWMIDLTYV